MDEPGATVPDAASPPPAPGASDQDPPTSRVVEPGPLDRPTVLALLARGDTLLDEGEYAQASAYYQRVVGFPEAPITALALLGLGESLYRLDHDDEALRTWESIFGLPETPVTYQAWRRVAAARVRDNDLRGAIVAYREADRRAPQEDKAEIASRLGWLAKETGDQRAAGRYFSRSRGDGPPVTAVNVILGVTAAVSLIALSGAAPVLGRELPLDKVAIASGEYWRLLSVTLLHGGLLHLAFNMYALYLVGPIVERQYGWRWFVILYLLCAAGGSVASYALGAGQVAVGASGAIFGLFGVVMAATRAHRPVLDRQARMIVPQLGTIVVINLVLGFLIPNIDNLAHIGGLAAGAWLGYLVPPARAATLAGMWQGVPEPETPISPRLVQAIGLVILAAFLVAGFLFGTSRWSPPESLRDTVRASPPGVALLAPAAGGPATRDRSPID